jgi:hypothetical protein
MRQSALRTQSSPQQEIERRKAELNKPGVLIDKIVSTAKALVKNSADLSRPTISNIGESSSSASARNVNSPQVRFSDIRDAEDDYAENDDDEEVRVDVDDPEDGIEEDEDPMEFFEAVRLFMLTMCQDTFVMRDGKDLRCSLCIEDPTINDQAKVRFYFLSIRFAFLSSIFLISSGAFLIIFPFHNFWPPSTTVML